MTDPNEGISGQIATLRYMTSIIGQRNYADLRLYLLRAIDRLAEDLPKPGWRSIDDDPPPMDGRSVWLAFEPEDWMCCEGRFQNGAWVIAATFYDPNRTPPMSYREIRLQPEKSPAYWQPLPEAPK